MKFFRRTAAAIGAFMGGGMIASEPLELAAEPTHSPVPVPDVRVEVKDYQYWREYFGNRKRRRGYSAKSPQWYGTEGFHFTDNNPWQLNQRLAPATGPNSYDQWKRDEAAKRAAKRAAA